MDIADTQNNIPNGRFSDGSYEIKKTALTESLDALKPDDIGKPKTNGFDLTEMTPQLVRWGIMLLCGIIFCVSSIYIIKALVEYSRMQSVYSQLSSDFADGDGSLAMAMPYKSVETPDFEKSQKLSAAELEALLNRNNLTDEERYARYRAKLALYKLTYPNVYGWIQIDGTNIDYIIMQSEDNEFYLTHDYTGSYSAGGSIFADYRCSKIIRENRNLILYGHHMSNATMFHMLDNYQNENFFQNHQYVLIHTEYASYKYQIFSIYQTTAGYKYIQTYFPTDKDFVDFANEMKSNSIWEREDVEFNAGSNLLTLSTCTNTGVDGRITVQAVLVEAFGEKEPGKK